MDLSLKHERKQDLKIVEAQNSIDVLQKHQSIPGQFLLEIFVTTTQTRGNWNKNVNADSWLLFIGIKVTYSLRIKFMGSLSPLFYNAKIFGSHCCSSWTQWQAQPGLLQSLWLTPLFWLQPLRVNQNHFGRKKPFFIHGQIILYL